MIRVTQLQAVIPQDLTVRLSTQAINAVVSNLAASARAKWLNLARHDASHLRDDYLQGIKETTLNKGQAIIALVGEIPHLLENGCNPYDMRDTLLGSKVPVVPKGQRGKHRVADSDDYYRAIPIRHMTPGSSNAFGNPMGDPYKEHASGINSKKLGKNVYKQAKALTASRTNPYGKQAYGQRLDTSEMNIPLLRPHHTTDIYSGMIRQEKVYTQPKKPQSQYLTFRTISTRKKIGWEHPGYTARNYANSVIKFVEEITPIAIEQIIKGD